MRIVAGRHRNNRELLLLKAFAVSRDDLRLVLFSTLIVALMVSGTIVILTNLRERMM